MGGQQSHHTSKQTCSSNQSKTIGPSNRYKWKTASIRTAGVNGCRALASLLTCGRPIERLDFDRNGLSGIDDVTAALATNPQIRVLSMTENELNDRDAELIAQALKPNTNLQQLYLGEKILIPNISIRGAISSSSY